MGCTWSRGLYLVRGVYLVLGVYLIQGVPGPGGCTWSGVYLVQGGVPGPRGVHLVWGGCTWSQGGVPGPGGVPGLGCTWSQGVYLVPGVYLVQGVYLVLGGCTWSRGAPGPRLVYLVPGGVRYSPLWTESHTSVKTLPCPNFVAGGNKSDQHWYLYDITHIGVSDVTQKVKIKNGIHQVMWTKLWQPFLSVKQTTTQCQKNKH